MSLELVDQAASNAGSLWEMLETQAYSTDDGVTWTAGTSFTANQLNGVTLRQ